MRALFFIPVLMMSMLSGCGPGETKPEDVEKEQGPSAEVYREEIKKLETKMRSSVTLDKAVAADAIELYSQYAKAFPADSITPDYLFKAGEIATGLGQYPQALKFYKQVSSGYPGFPLVQESLYLQGNLLDNYMNRDPEARVVYEELIKKYPDSPYAKDAAAAISNLGKSDEQIIKEFEKKNGGK